MPIWPLAGGRIGMRIQTPILFLVVALVCVVARGSSVTVSFYALGSLSEMADGWTSSGVTLSSKTGDYKGGLMFSGVKHWLRSPRFGFAIEGVSVWFTYNMDEGGKASRYLALHPYFGDVEAEALHFNEPRWATSYQEQTFSDFEGDTDEFIIRLDGEGKYGNWYVKEVTVTYDDERPVFHEKPDEPDAGTHMSLTNRWKVSEFAKIGSGKFAHDADFSPLVTIQQQTDWTNGETVDSFYGFSEGVAFDYIRQARASAYMCGLYAIQTNGVGGLAVLGTKSGDASFMLPLELDAEQKARSIVVAYRCWQPKVGAADTTLAFNWCATDSLDEMEKVQWVPATDGDYSGGGFGVLKTVEIPGHDFKGAKFICFRWGVSKQSSSSLLGISDLRITADLGRPGFAVMIK